MNHAPPLRAFEDFATGDVSDYGPAHVEPEAMVAFARVYDAQPMHVDAEAAKSGFTGGLIASGWYTAALHMRLFADDVLHGSTSMGSPGLEELKWLAPVYAGSKLFARREVLSARPSASKPDRGVVVFRFDVRDETGRAVLSQENAVLFGRRGAAREPSAPKPVPPMPAVPVRDAPPVDVSGWRGPRGFDEVQVGDVADLGSHLFTAEGIKSFARDFDPQPFHVDEAAAARSHFGGLVASGWHTGSMWMRGMAQHREEARRAETAAFGRAVELGPSPGFRNLRWLAPVRAGDVITYRSRVTDKRLTRSRPGWGLVFHSNDGVNGRGETVFSFDGCVFWPKA